MSKSLKLAPVVTVALLLAAWTAPAHAQCSPSIVTLFAGQTIHAGFVTVTNDGVNLYVEYTTNSPWLMTEAHLAVADSLAGIPQTKKGNPIPGQFPYSATFNPGVNDFIFTIPLGSFVPGDELFIAAHAVVTSPGGHGSGGTQTGWGDGAGFPGANWATYFQYIVQTCGGPVE